MSKKPLLQFPKDFMWGAASSSHQVEGNQDNNWTEWEKHHANALSRGSKKAFDTPAVHWYRIKDQAMDPHNYISARGVDHFKRYESDFDIARSLNHNAHRFSLEWSRIQPGPGVFDEKMIEHYRNVITALHRRGIEPILTLWHFSLPKWVQAQGGFTNPATIADFERYASRMAQEFGSDIKYWCTINEPEVFTSFSYWLGFWPPGQKNIGKAFVAYTSILPRAHISAYRAIKKYSPNARVGISKNMMWYSAEGRFLTPAVAFFWNWFGNYYFLDQIKKYQDYIGLNYYFKYVLKGLKWSISEQNPSDMGWGLHPEGMYELLRLIGKRYPRTPVLITECGLADAQDESRAWYIKEILRSIHRAMKEGVDVEGFLYWALLDNFEWDKGYWPKFGLVEVDRKTMKRTIRPSAKIYADIIKAGGLD